MTSITITWHATIDARTCKICRALHMQTWTFVVGSTPMGDNLTHPVYGEVWNTMQGSQAHGHTNVGCRCYITAKIDVGTLLQKVQKMKTEIEANMNEQSG